MHSPLCSVSKRWGHRHAPPLPTLAVLCPLIFFSDRASCILGWLQTLFVAKDDLELLITLPPPRERRCAPPRQVCTRLEMEPSPLCVSGEHSQLGYCPQSHSVLEDCLELLLTVLHPPPCQHGSLGLSIKILITLWL